LGAPLIEQVFIYTAENCNWLHVESALNIWCSVGLEHLYSYLHEKMAFAFLLTHILNQDCLENHFAVIRGLGAFRDNPTPYMFAAAFRQVMVQHLVSPPKSANCDVDLTGVLLLLQDIEKQRPV